MRFSKEKTEEIKQSVRVELVKNPSASIYSIQKELEKIYNHSFDKNFIAKLKRKVHRERAGLYNVNIYQELGLLQDIVRLGREELSSIIDDEKAKDSQKIRAFSSIVNMEISLFYAKLNAGIYEKKFEKKRELTVKEKAEIDEIVGFFSTNALKNKVENIPEN